MIFQIIGTPVPKSIADYQGPSHAPYQHMINAYFASRPVVWELTVQIALKAPSKSGWTLSAVPHLDACLKNPFAVFQSPNGPQAYEAVLYAPPSHHQQYAWECEHNKCFRAQFLAGLMTGIFYLPQLAPTASVDSVERIPDASSELPFCYHIFASCSVELPPGSWLKLMFELQTPEGVRQPAGFLLPPANRWVPTEYKGESTVKIT